MSFNRIISRFNSYLINKSVNAKRLLSEAVSNSSDRREQQS